MNDWIISLFNAIRTDPSNTIQTLIFLALIATGTLIWRQLRATNKSIRLSTIIPRMEAFNAITSGITDEDVKSFIIHKSENFTGEIYRRYYEEGGDDRIKSYIIMKRKYMYLLFCSEELEKHHYDFEKDSLNIWLKELMQYNEFRHLHMRLGKYYKDFDKKVKDIDIKYNVPNRGWMYKQSGELTTDQNDK